MKKSHLLIVATLSLLIGFSISWVVYQNREISLQTGLYFADQARDLPPFELIDHNQQTFTNEQLKGQWSLVFFGYTYCPDICPLGLQTLAQMVKTIDDQQVTDQLNIVFVSVDPERDTPARLSQYVPYFNPDFIGATADESILRPFTSSLGIHHELERDDPSQTSYEVSHSSAILLINPKGQYAGLFQAPHKAKPMAADLTAIIERG